MCGRYARERAEVLGLKLRLSSLHRKHRFLLSHLPNPGPTSFKVEKGCNRMGRKEACRTARDRERRVGMGTVELDGAQDRVMRETSPNDGSA